jgi:hypothetical protein
MQNKIRLIKAKALYEDEDESALNIHSTPNNENQDPNAPDGDDEIVDEVENEDKSAD